MVSISYDTNGTKSLRRRVSEGHMMQDDVFRVMKYICCENSQRIRSRKVYHVSLLTKVVSHIHETCRLTINRCVYEQNWYLCQGCMWNVKALEGGKVTEARKLLLVVLCDTKTAMLFYCGSREDVNCFPHRMDRLLCLTDFVILHLRIS